LQPIEIDGNMNAFDSEPVINFEFAEHLLTLAHNGTWRTMDGGQETAAQSIEKCRTPTPYVDFPICSPLVVKTIPIRC
jgi:hypothetical protein